MVAKDAEWLWRQAAGTQWECARLFATRSKELLLESEVPPDCYELVDYKVVTTGVKYLRGNRLPPLPSLEQVGAWTPCDDDAYEGLTSFEMPGHSLHLKQARPNVGPTLLDTAGMRESIEHEFAAFSFYRLVEREIPSMQVHVRDCAKISFDVVVEGPKLSPGLLRRQWALQCIVFEKLETLEPARVGWKMIDELSKAVCRAMMSKHLNITANEWEALTPLADLSSSRNFMDTTEALVERWKVTAQLSEEDAVKCIAQLGPGKRHHIFVRTVATEFALEGLKGAAADIFLANVYGWGVFDKPQLFRCSKTRKLYRMSADTALGRCGTEPLNRDRSETWANLGFLTFMAAAAEFPFFIKWLKGSSAARSKEEIGPMTYSENTNFPLLPFIDEQFEELEALVAQRDEEILEIFTNLPVPRDVYRVAALFPQEVGWMADIESQEFWHSFVYDRIGWARRRFRNPKIPPPWNRFRFMLGRAVAQDLARSKAFMDLWAGYNTGVRIQRELRVPGWVLFVALGSGVSALGLLLKYSGAY